MLQYIAAVQGAEALMELLQDLIPLSGRAAASELTGAGSSRAIEFYLMTGTPISARVRRKRNRKESRYRALFLAVEWERAECICAH